MDNKVKLRYLVHSLVVLFLAFLAWGIIPLYGMPFGGCESNSHELGCLDWPRQVRGFLFISIALFLGPNNRVYLISVISLFLLVSILGGPESLRYGEHFHISSIEDMLWLAHAGKNYFIGGLSGFLLNASFSFLWRVYR